MPVLGEKMRALLATGRIANLPTVCSNVLAGYYVSLSLFPDVNQGALTQASSFAPLLFLMLSCCIIYVAGCMLGDALDYSFDLKNRPQRPIPLGILDAGRIKVASYSLFVLALIILCLISLLTGSLQPDPQNQLTSIQRHEIFFGCLLSIVVICYAFYHKKNKPAALIMMGSCRFLLVILAISFAHKALFRPSPNSEQWLPPHLAWLASWLIIPAIGVAAYTIILSWVASTESKPGVFQSRNILTLLLLVVPLSSMAVAFQMSNKPEINYLSYSIAMALCYLWMYSGIQALKKSKPLFVSKALAGFCLLDATFLAPIDPITAVVCIALFLVALGLQKIAPAT
ncbi:MAG: UbiA family prenyltransferase [Akkermansiaceae bacterium]